MGAMTLMYCVLLGDKAFALLATGIPIGIAMGALLILFPIAATGLTIREFIFGTEVERLAAEIETAGQWPVFELEIRPSGRPTRETAQAEFERQKQLVESNPNDKLRWFALSLAYDAAGDRKRAREAMRRAIKIAKAAKSA